MENNRIRSKTYSLLHTIEAWAEKNPNNDCLVIPATSETYSYRDVSLKVNRTANGLKSLGVEPGDKVALSMTNCAEYVFGLYGAIKARAVAVPMNPVFKVEEARYIIENSEARVVIVNTTTLPVYRELMETQGCLDKIILVGDSAEPGTASFKELLAGSSDQLETPLFASNDVCIIMYTSGTTGKPKGVTQTHLALWANKRVFVEDWDMVPSDRAFTCAPLCFAAAQGAALDTTLMAGGTLYIGTGWKGAQDAMAIIEKFKITYFFGPPVFWVFILNDPKLNDFDLSSLRIAFSGGAPLAVETFQQFQEHFGYEIVEGAGMTETGPLYAINPFQGIKKPGSCGLPVPNIRVQIVDDDEKPLSAGQDGEICFKGVHVTDNYWKMPEETAGAMRGGWFHTGDIGHLDEDGYIYITDRKKDIVIRGATNIASREVEEAIFHHEKVLEAAVIGVPDKVMGEELKAFVVPLPEVETGETLKDSIREFVGLQLSKFKVPRYIEFLKELPHTPSGKVRKVELRKLAFEPEEYKKR